MNLSLVIDDGRLAHLLQLAYEGGMRRWFSLIILQSGPERYEDIDPGCLGFYFPLRSGRWLVRVHNNEKPLTLDRDAIERGIQHIADHLPEHFEFLLRDKPDDPEMSNAEFGDLLVQYALFGEERYPNPSGDSMSSEIALGLDHEGAVGLTTGPARSLTPTGATVVVACHDHQLEKYAFGGPCRHCGAPPKSAGPCPGRA